jgi:hypothetical protein
MIATYAERHGPSLGQAVDLVNGDALIAKARELGRDTDDELITLRQAAAELPRRRAGRKTHVSCVYRWTTAGCRGVRLRYAQCGATRCTSRAWLREFFDALTAATMPAGATPLRASARRQQELARVDAELDARGV